MYMLLSVDEWAAELTFTRRFALWYFVTVMPVFHANSIWSFMVHWRKLKGKGIGYSIIYFHVKWNNK